MNICGKKKNTRAGWGGGNITETFMTSALTILFDRWGGPGVSRGRVGLFCIVDGTSHPACL